MGSKPQQPESMRSGHSPTTVEDNAPKKLESHGWPVAKGPAGPVPEANRPAHRPAADQDKPDLEQFRRRLAKRPAPPAPRTDPSTDGRADGRTNAGTDPGTDPGTESLRAAAEADASAPKSHLYELARELDVPGRSRMDKRQLAKALRAAGKRHAAS